MAEASPLAALLASIAREPQRWRWQREAGDAQALSPALQRWLVRLDEATVGHWRRAVLLAAVAADAPPLRLLRDGVPQLMLRLGPEAVWAEPADAAQPAAQAPVAAALIAELKQGLADAAP